MKTYLIKDTTSRCVRLGPAKTVGTIVLMLAICLISGCYERVADGNASTYKFAWWLGPAVIFGGILAVPLGWLLRRSMPRWGYGLMVIGPLALIFAAPAMYSDRVFIDDQHFEARFGFWFSPTVQDVKFSELQEIRYIQVTDNRGKAKYELHCVYKTGQTIIVPAGDLVRQTVPEILSRARERGVSVVNLATGGIDKR